MFVCVRQKKRADIIYESERVVAALQSRHLAMKVR